MRDPSTVRIRPLDSRDAAAARALLEGEVGGTPYAPLYRHILSLALEAGSGEAIGLVADWPGESEPVGVCLYGWAPGAVRTGRIYFVAVTASARLQGVGSRLIDAAIERLERDRARILVAEGPDDASIRPAHLLMQSCGFEEQARVPDFYRDGVDLILSRRRVGAAPAAESPARDDRHASPRAR